MMVSGSGMRAFGPSLQEAEAGGFQVWGQAELCPEMLSQENGHKP